MDQKFFPTAGGAHKYAENSSRKHSANRYVIKCVGGYLVGSTSDLEKGETLEAIYFKGEKI